MYAAELSLRIEYADLSLVGTREDNQDRVAVAVSEHSVLLVVIDGMGGHADGAKAADTALKSMLGASKVRIIYPKGSGQVVKVTF